ncbi:MAG: sugar phosphate isomerase/epimerase [Bacteroidetes bacterium]|nr:sugar phosphate isomerase/epimerase [Bacteroidota bacterium]
MLNRRSFIRNSGTLALSIPFLKSELFKEPKLNAFGIQLYMVRDVMEKDPKTVLRILGDMGYSQIESFKSEKGMFWGMTNKEFKKVSSGYGLNLISTHYDDDEIPFEKKAAEAAEIGMKYLICPWKGPQKSIDDFKRIADDFNNRGKICKQTGIRFGYHAHDYPYKKIDGQFPIDVLLENTDKDLVDYQMDFYYTVTEGQDPEAYLKKYKDRFRLCHMRDVMKKRLPAGSQDESACDLGEGIINYPSLIQTALDNGVIYFFVEQSRYFEETTMQSAKNNADYLKKFLS